MEFICDSCKKRFSDMYEVWTDKGTECLECAVYPYDYEIEQGTIYNGELIYQSYAKRANAK